MFYHQEDDTILFDTAALITLMNTTIPRCGGRLHVTTILDILRASQAFPAWLSFDGCLQVTRRAIEWAVLQSKRVPVPRWIALDCATHTLLSPSHPDAPIVTDTVPIRSKKT